MSMSWNKETIPSLSATGQGPKVNTWARRDQRSRSCFYKEHGRRESMLHATEVNQFPRLSAVNTVVFSRLKRNRVGYRSTWEAKETINYLAVGK